MKFLIILMIFFVSLCHANMADSILNNYQEKFDQMPIVKQGHFALRMYRMTGNHVYLKPIISYIYFLRKEAQELYYHLDHPDTIGDKSNQMLSVAPNPKVIYKYQLRVKKIALYGDLFFYLNLLDTTSRIFSYHLENTDLFPNTSDFVNAIKAKLPHLQPFLLDEENIKIYGAQIANFIYDLDDLNIINLKNAYIKKFKDTFPDRMDSQLSTLDYESKIYGMTHFITAASHYYQNTVNDKALDWVSEYFEANIDQIIEQTENDVIAEVGVCLMLVNKKNSPAIDKIMRHLRQQYNSQYKIIPSRTKYTDFIYGEHRNILTIMLFKWPENLTQGPSLLFSGHHLILH